MSNVKSLDALNKYVSGNLGKNLLVNGDFSVWQRGTGPFTEVGYVADRWYVPWSFHEVSELAVPESSSGKGIHIIRPGNTTERRIRQPIELNTTGEAGPFQIGRSVTLSGWRRVNIAGDFRLNIVFSDGAAESNIATVLDIDIPITDIDTWVRFEQTVEIAVAPNPTNTCLYVGIGHYVGVDGVELDLYDIQLELGDTATDFEIVTPADQLARCQRYFFMLSGFKTGGFGIVTSVTTSVFHVPISSRLRDVPVVESAGTTYIVYTYAGSITATISSIVIEGHMLAFRMAATYPEDMVFKPAMLKIDTESLMLSAEL